MIGPGTGVRVYLACGVTDMRKGIAGLSAIAQDVLRQRPSSGAVFAFRGRKGDRIKLLYWNGQRFCLYYKVLEKERSLACGQRWGCAPDLCATGHAVGGYRLAASGLGRAASPGWVNYCTDIACFYGTTVRIMVVTLMSESTLNLSDDPAVLKAIIASLEAENAKLSATLRAHDLLVQTLRVRIAKLQKQAFGKSSEKIEREIAQLELALEDLQVAMAEAEETAGTDDDDEGDVAIPSEVISEEKRPRRRPRISKGTPRERRELDPGDSCPDCGGDLRVLGEDVSELIDMIAAQLKVIEIARIKKSCRRCEKIVQEPAPSRPIPRSMAGPGLLAYILTSKFDDHVPLYRQHEIFERMGAERLCGNA